MDDQRKKMLELLRSHTPCPVHEEKKEAELDSNGEKINFDCEEELDVRRKEDLKPDKFKPEDYTRAFKRLYNAVDPLATPEEKHKTAIEVMKAEQENNFFKDIRKGWQSEINKISQNLNIGLPVPNTDKEKKSFWERYRINILD